MTCPRLKTNLIGILRIFFLPILLIAETAVAQSSITGVVVGENNNPVTHANVLLLQSKDSSLVKGILSADDGSFVFQNVPAGEYLVESSSTGFKQAYSNPFTITENGSTNVGKMILSQSFSEMNSVIVVAKKPLYEQKQDRLVINVQNSITAAGNSALDVLERSPGVTIDRQIGSIAIKGKEGVAIMINGKINYMPASAAIEMLQGMNSGDIEKIELITVPPSKVDAEGQAGYINIVLKSSDRYGTNGSVSGTIGYGNGPVAAATVSLNHRQGKINVYGNLSYSRVEKPLPIYLHSKFVSDGNILENFFATDRNEITANFNGRIGIDYQYSNKTVFGILISGYDNHYTQSENNDVLMLKNSKTDTTAKQHNSELNHWQNIGVNLNMQHDFSQNSKLTVNLDYIYYRNNQPFTYHSSFYDNEGKFVYDEHKMSTKQTPISFWIAAVDYSKKFGQKFLLEFGFKSTVAHFYNDLGVLRLKQGAWIEDSALTAQYTMNENYTAGYVSSDYTISKDTKAKLGLRYEYTNSNLGNTTVKNIVDKHYANLFPVISLSHAFNENNGLTLSYNMRIARPTFNNLAPYIYYVNENTVVTGNQTLQPSIANTIAVDYSFRKYILSVSFTDESNGIAIFQPTIDAASKKVILRPENIDQRLASIMITAPIDVNEWWTMQYNVMGVWQEVTAGADASKNAYMNVNLNATETFKLRKNISFELSGMWQSKRYEGIYLQKGYGSLNVGIRKKLAGTGGTFTLSAVNLLVTMDKIWNADYPERNLVTDFHVNFNQRTYSLTYSRNFGNNKLRDKRERATGAEDEKGRVQ